MDILLKFKPGFTARDVGVLSRRTGLTNWNVTLNPRNYETVQINSVNNKTKISAWKNERCNRIHGNEGFFVSPRAIWRREEFFTFLPFFCYAFPLEFVEEVS